MICRVFLDSNVLFSAILSPQGAARKILLLSTGEAIHTIISQQVAEEVKRNLSRKYPELLDLLPLLLQEAEIEIVEDPNPEAIQRVLDYLPYPSAAAVLAAARESQADYFVTGDKEHFLSKPELEDHVSFAILSPREFLEQVV
mgnify:CR=1 FL=1